jgi:ribosomal protein S27E
MQAGIMRTKCNCGAEFNAGPELIGKQVKCPQCGNAFVVQSQPPAAPQPSGTNASGTIDVKWGCGGAFQANPELAGKRIKCPKCSQPLTIPNPNAAANSQSTNAAPQNAGQPIVAHCACGAGFKAPPHLAGQQVQCPQCRQPMMVPSHAAPQNNLGPMPTNNPFGDSGSANPLGSVNPPGSIDPLGGGMPASSGMGDFGLAPADGSMTLQPSVAPAPAPTKRRKKSKGPTFNSDILGIIGAVAGLLFLVAAIGGVFFFPLGIFVLLVLFFDGSLIGSVGSIWMLIKAFEEDVGQGLLILFVPFYGLYYLLTNWDDSLYFQLLGFGILAQLLAIPYMFMLGLG